MGRYIRRIVWENLLEKSKNRCAFPGCNQVIVADDNIMIGQMAHIEAYNPGGPRYNQNLTEKQKNGIDNLIYLCPTHHTIIDKNESIYTVDILKNMKNEHEKCENGERYTFDYNKIYEKNIELQLYLEDLENENRKNVTELRIPIYKDKSFDTLTNEIYTIINWIDKRKDEFIKFSSELNENIIEQMKRLGMDSTKWEKIPYYENQFYMPMWEAYTIGFENALKDIRLKLKLIEIYYYTEYLKYNVDNNIQKKIDIIKKELMKLAPRIAYHD